LSFRKKNAKKICHNAKKILHYDFFVNLLLIVFRFQKTAKPHTINANLIIISL